MPDLAFHRMYPASLAVALLAASPAFLGAQIDFSVVSVSEPLTPADLQAALGAPSTLAVDGVAKTWGDEIFVVHVDGTGVRRFARIHPETKAVTFAMTSAELAAQLGAPYFPTFTLVGEFVYDPRHDRLVFADNSLALPPTFEFGLLTINVGAETATELLRGSDITGWSSHGILSTGTIVAALGEERSDLLPGEEPVVGLVDPNDPAFIPLFYADDFAEAAEHDHDDDDDHGDDVPRSRDDDHEHDGEFPPETIAIDPRNDNVYIFCHDALELFFVHDIEDDDHPPHLHVLEIDGWNGVVDLHAMDVDEAGNLYGYDEGDPAIVIWDGEDTHRFSLADVQTALEKEQTFVPTNWRGMKARQINATQTEVLLASASSAYGVVRIVFGEEPVDPSIDSDGDGFSDEYERTVGTNPFLPNSVPTLGDVNDDGVVDVADLDAVVNHIVGNAPVSAFIADRADITGDGAVNVADVTRLANYLNGKVEVLR